ncbi:hypothetical protein C8Q80DRAFT_1157639 [Daedaleopsis nitida]|nr:hypothetical protein C8Q80DRAFT_1157639 [Daedaleopsis nitida]
MSTMSKASSTDSLVTSSTAPAHTSLSGGRGVMTRKMRKLASESLTESQPEIETSAEEPTHRLLGPSHNPDNVRVKMEEPDELPLLDFNKGDDAIDEMALLFDDARVDNAELEEHELKTAPMFTREAFLSAGVNEENSQYGVLGRIISIHDQSGVRVPEEPRLYVNTNAPFSALVCGVQGSGKSHTVSVMMENMFIPNVPGIGSCKQALSGLVLHFSEGGSGARPCEAAWIGCPKTDDIGAPSVRVYVSKSSLNTMKKVYAPLGDKVSVRSLRFSESELDAQAILSMMAVGSSEFAPLYMQSLLAILRELGENFTYSAFLSEVEKAKRDMNPHQKSSLNQRLSLLASFADAEKPRKGALFKAGRLTIIDLSDPFIDPASACSLFEIVTRLFIRSEPNTGKLLVVDEAHKYLSAQQGNSGLTKALTSLIRQQRHLAMRVILSTQEPTAVPPVLIDLCSIAIFHRFSSPAWWEAVARRVCADVSNAEGFGHVVKLMTGQALVLCPSGLGLFATKKAPRSRPPAPLKLGQFGRRYMLIKTRQRITMDGGASIMALDA